VYQIQIQELVALSQLHQRQIQILSLNRLLERQDLIRQRHLQVFLAIFKIRRPLITVLVQLQPISEHLSIQAIQIYLVRNSSNHYLYLVPLSKAILPSSTKVKKMFHLFLFHLIVPFVASNNSSVSSGLFSTPSLPSTTPSKLFTNSIQQPSNVSLFNSGTPSSNLFGT
jgi:hypothetical protein